MKRKLLALSAALMLLAACGNPTEMFLKFVPREDALARDFIAKVKEGSYDAATEMLGPELQPRAGEARTLLETMNRMFNRGEPWSIEPVDLQSMPAELTGGESDVRRTALTYQIHSADMWILTEVVIDTAGDRLSIAGIHYQPLPASLAELNAFTFKGKSLVHYLFFALVLLYPLFLIYTVVRIIRSKVRRRWLWVLLTFVGICQVSLNWTTGEVNLQPISFHIPGVGFFRPGTYGPWSFLVCIPVGALAFYIKRRSLKPVTPPPPPPDPQSAFPDDHDAAAPASDDDSLSTSGHADMSHFENSGGQG